MKLPSVLTLAALWLASVAAFTTPAARIHHAAMTSTYTTAPPMVGRHAFTSTHLSPSTTIEQDPRIIEEGLRIRRERQRQVRDKGVLRFLYTAATGLCIQMATEILISPGNLLPGALWAALIPFQLHPIVRKTHPKMHQAMSFACLGSAACMTYGLYNVLKEGLSAAVPVVLQPVNLLLLSWFAFTGAKTFQFALRCKSKSTLTLSDFAHQRWMLRHVGSGLWIAVHRLLAWTVGAWTMMPLSPDRQRFLLAVAARAAAVATIGAAEYAVSVVNRQKHGYRGETVDFDGDEY